jgi:hypothetical protein
MQPIPPPWHGCCDIILYLVKHQHRHWRRKRRTTSYWKIKRSKKGNLRSGAVRIPAQPRTVATEGLGCGDIT